MTPYISDADFTLYCGDAISVLAELPPASVHCCVTSPPYWGLRDYGTGTWDGGDPDCDHLVRTDPNLQSSTLGGGKATTGHQREGFKDVCPRCGATRVDRQIGLEQTPDEYVQRMVDVFRQVRRVLRDDGTLWLNLGDSYASAWACDRRNVVGAGSLENGKRDDRPNRLVGGLKEKDLVGIPWRVAFALQQDGWYLRSDIIWAKPNPMPESVTDRPTKAHEYVFLLTKSPRYYFDQEAVRESAAGPDRGPGMTRGVNGPHAEQAGLDRRERRTTAISDLGDTGRNVRSVWEIATQPYAEAHFATFPLELPRRCIAAGTSERGCCPDCGAPWERQTERGESQYSELKGDRDWREMAAISAAQGKGVRPGQSENLPTHANHTMTGHGTVPSLRARQVKTLGWMPSCGCGLSKADPLVEGSNIEIESASRDSNIEWSASENPRPPVPCVVLDPFMGSGTTAYVARQLGRTSVGIELNPDYCKLAAARLGQQSLLAAVYDS